MADVVPVGISVWVDGDMLRFGNSTGSYACQWLHKGEGDVIVEACVHALDDLRNYVDEETIEPWPGSGAPPAPGARIEDGRVLLWSGDAEDPVLWLEPIPLTRPA
jgi:hypothetical protein